jgi:hypothetical protein
MDMVFMVKCCALRARSIHDACQMRLYSRFRVAQFSCVRAVSQFAGLRIQTACHGTHLFQDFAIQLDDRIARGFLREQTRLAQLGEGAVYRWNGFAGADR